MTPEQFCYWLQGRAELQPENPPSPEEWASIREHLQTVFVKVTSPLGGGIVKQGRDHQIVPGLPWGDLPAKSWEVTSTDRPRTIAIC